MLSIRDRRFRMGLGLGALLCYAVHAAYEASIGDPACAVWACSLGAILVGLGLLLGRPVLNGIGLMWLILGVPLWIIELADHGGLEFTSTLVHVGGLAAGLAGVRAMGLPRGVWWKAVVLLYLLHRVSRWITPEEDNVNFAFRVWNGWEAYFPHHDWYIVMIVAVSGLAFAAAELVLRRMLAAADPRTEQPN